MPDTTTTGPRFVGMDRKTIAEAQARFEQGDAHAVDDCLAHMGMKRFMRAAPADMKAELQATLKKAGAQMADKLRAASAKAKPTTKAKPRPVRTTFARPAAQPAARAEPEGTKELRALIAQHAPHQTAPAATSQADIARTWQEAHDKVARETGRTR